MSLGFIFRIPQFVQVSEGTGS